MYMYIHVCIYIYVYIYLLSICWIEICWDALIVFRDDYTYWVSLVFLSNQVQYLLIDQLIMQLDVFSMWSFGLVMSDKDVDGQEASRSRCVSLITGHSNASTDIPCLQPMCMLYYLMPASWWPKCSTNSTSHFYFFITIVRSFSGLEFSHEGRLCCVRLIIFYLSFHCTTLYLVIFRKHYKDGG